MGYTHYWYRQKDIPSTTFNAIVGDFKRCLLEFRRMGVVLKGGAGEGEPTITSSEVIFNGDRHCGHTREDLGIMWPSESAVGVGLLERLTNGEWYAGKTVETRTCDGDCSHETFAFPRSLSPSKKPVQKIAYYDIGRKPIYNEPIKVGKYFDFCKTAFKPYDLAVTVFLVIAKHHLGSKIVVESDGELQHWVDAVIMCYNVLGYDPAIKVIG